MKYLKNLTIAGLLSGAVVFGLTACKSSSDDHSGHDHGSAGTSGSTAGVKPYPLKTCIMTDEAFDHGKPYTFVHNGQEIKMCCDGCKPDFDKDPAKYLKKLETASKK